MRRLFLLTLLFLFAPNAAFADYFQIFETSRPYYIPYARVSLDAKFVGYTDMYGRIKIDRPPGQYVGVVSHRGASRKMRMIFDGTGELKRVEAF
jgi:hypothetical protein